MKKKHVTPQTVISVILLILLAFAFIFPLYWIVTGAFKAKEDIIIKSGEMVQWFPLHPTLQNFVRLFTKEAELFRIPIPFAGVSVVAGHPLAGQQRVHLPGLHGPHLYHRLTGRLCPG